MKQFTLIALLASVLWTHTVNAQSSAPDSSTTLRVTGVLLPHEEQQRDDLVTATIFVQDKPWLFRVGKVEGLTSEEREQAVKDGALLEQVRFYGPDAVMRRLQKANLIGKLLTIEGQLDAKGRRFLVSVVEEVAGAAPKSHWRDMYPAYAHPFDPHPVPLPPGEREPRAQRAGDVVGSL